MIVVSLYRNALQAELTDELLTREVNRRRNFAIISHPDAGKVRGPCVRGSQGHNPRSGFMSCTPGSMVREASASAQTLLP